MNKFKTISAEIVKKVAPVLDKLADDFTKWLDGGGWKNIMKMVEAIGSTLMWIANHPKTVMALLGALAGAGVGFMMGGPAGALAGLVIGGAVGGGGGAMMGLANGGTFVTSGPQPIMVGDNPGGREHVSVSPIGAGRSAGAGGGGVDTTPVANEVSVLRGDIQQLTRNMDSYFGIGGTATREMGRHAGRAVEEGRDITSAR